MLADSSINDQLVKLRSLIDLTCFEFIDVAPAFRGAVNFLPQNTPDTAHHSISVLEVGIALQITESGFYPGLNQTWCAVLG